VDAELASSFEHVPPPTLGQSNTTGTDFVLVEGSSMTDLRDRSNTMPAHMGSTITRSGSRKVLRVQFLEDSVENMPSKEMLRKELLEGRAYVQPARVGSKESILNDLKKVSEHAQAGEEFRKRIQAIREEAGSTWLKVYNEIQAKQELDSDEERHKEDDTKKTLVTLDMFEATEADIVLPRELDLPEVQAETSEPVSLLSKSLETELSVPRDADLSKSEILTNTSVASDNDENPYNVDLSLPLFAAQVQELSKKGARRVKKLRDVIVPCKLRLGAKELVEIDLQTDTVTNRRQLYGLLKVHRGKEGSHKLFLRFRYAKLDPIIDVELAVSGIIKVDENGGMVEDEGQNAVVKLEKELAKVVKTNWDKGWWYEVMKQSRCLNCSWTGFEEELKVVEAKDGEDDEDHQERRCPSCNKSYLVEFYGEKPADADPKSAESLLGILSTSPVLAVHGFVKGTIEESIDLIGGAFLAPVRMFSATPADSKTAKPALLSVVDAPPFQNAADSSLALHLKLQVFASDAEQLEAWMGCGMFRQRKPLAPKTASSSPWGLFSAIGSLVDRPEETAVAPPLPVFCALTSKSLYVVELVRPAESPDSGKKDVVTAGSMIAGAGNAVGVGFGMLAHGLTSLPGVSPSQKASVLAHHAHVSLNFTTHGFPDVTRAEKNMDKHLHVLHAVPLTDIVHMEMDDDLQALTLHFALYDDHGVPVKPVSNVQLPGTSLTFVTSSTADFESKAHSMYQAWQGAKGLESAASSSLLRQWWQLEDGFDSMLGSVVCAWRSLEHDVDQQGLRLRTLSVVRATSGEETTTNLFVQTVQYATWPPPVATRNSLLAHVHAKKAVQGAMAQPNPVFIAEVVAPFDVDASLNATAVRRIVRKLHGTSGVVFTSTVGAQGAFACTWAECVRIETQDGGWELWLSSRVEGDALIAWITSTVAVAVEEE
jgi:hypothetical protein